MSSLLCLAEQRTCFRSKESFDCIRHGSAIALDDVKQFFIAGPRSLRRLARQAFVRTQPYRYFHACAAAPRSKAPVQRFVVLASPFGACRSKLGKQCSAVNLPSGVVEREIHRPSAALIGPCHEL